MSGRNEVSSDAIVRAIKARMAVDQGIEAPAILTPIRIAETEPDSSGCNWTLRAEGTPEPLRDTLISAAQGVAHVYKLETRRNRN